MIVRNRSFFKDPQAAHQWFDNWVTRIEQLNQKRYQRITVRSSLGETHVWGLNVDDENAETLVIFPGARTSALFWDFDNNLNHLNGKYRVFMVETNGLPNLSNGSSPDIRSLGYGQWASEIFDRLNINSAFVAGASFGGLVCMKLAIFDPSRIQAAFLLNPGCLQPFSLSPKNLYYNILPIVFPSSKNVSRFLDSAVFCKPEHQLTPEAERLLIEYEVFALKEYKDNTQKPYDMGDELKSVNVNTYLYVGDKDLLFPYETSIRNAHERIKTLRDVVIYKNVGHGIETYDKALAAIGDQMTKLTHAVVFPTVL